MISDALSDCVSDLDNYLGDELYTSPYDDIALDAVVELRNAIDDLRHWFDTDRPVTGPPRVASRRGFPLAGYPLCGAERNGHRCVAGRGHDGAHASRDGSWWLDDGAYYFRTHAVSPHQVEQDAGQL